MPPINWSPGTIGSSGRCVSMDLIEGLPPYRGYSRLLVFRDSLSRYIQATPLPNRLASTICEAFDRTWLVPLGNVQRIHSDNAKEFVSAEFKALCDQEGIKHIFSAPYAHQQNGGIERVNKYIREQIRVYQAVTGKATCWFHSIGKIIRKYNLTVQATTGEAPFTLHFRDLQPKTTIPAPFSQFVEGDLVWVRRLPTDPKILPNVNGFWVAQVLGSNLYLVTDGSIKLRRSGRQLQKRTLHQQEPSE